MVTRSVRLPLMGETVTEAVIVRWLRRVGEPVVEGEALFEVSTDKVDTEVPAPLSGTLTGILVGEGMTATIGQVIANVETTDTGDTLDGPDVDDGSVAAGGLVAERAGLVEEPPAANGAPRVTPLPPRRSQPELRPSPERRPSASSSASAAVTPPAVSDEPAWVPFSPMRRVIAARMTESLHVAAHTLVVMEADYENVARARAERPGLTYLPFVCRAIVDALRDFPLVNAHVSDDGLRPFDVVNLGIAVDLDLDGLVVPVVQQAERLRLSGIAAAITEVAGRARARSLPSQAYDGGTITVTNAGGRGSLFGRPIINLPQAAIVETDAVEERLVGTRDQSGALVVQLRRRGYLSMSYDHRAFDGAYACGFLSAVCRTISERDWAAEL
ncbi:MAG TPA: dihydrolipoamide acetyltransferase family protein [Ilumatobacteraceae bacterium]|nr:dihydrolipoamide acetyltransferase family protein [Ilumatobacteraceae bacterium]